ncbi:hypothetical protein [Hydrogenophaga sp. ZJX-1]|uniref:hypothetical protein n=1 Tax=Hydrogenophaga sp. ZJX-1 TaxID=3404778 RepID=UPI003B27EC01
MFDKSKLTYGLTAFLDILGFGAQVLSVTPEEDLEGLLNDIRLIRKEFEHEPSDPSDQEIHLAYGKTVLAFSDSVIVNIPLVSRMVSISGEFDALGSELHSMALAQFICIENALFLRGGVDLDWWYLDGTTLVSKSLANAYSLEGKACVPVIAVSNKLYSFLENNSGRRNYSPDIDPLLANFRRFSGEVAGKTIDIRFLDYLSIVAGEIDWSATPAKLKFLASLDDEQKDKQKWAWHQENLRTLFAVHARTVEMAHSRCEEASIQAKYLWLAEYHNEVASEFSIDDPSCFCAVEGISF